MSKAFTKDDAPDAPLIVPARPPLPDGVANYVTARGWGLLRDELALLRLERARLEVASEDPDRPRDLTAANARLVELEDRLTGAVLVGLPSEDALHVVRFGAKVTLRPEEGPDRTYQIVGVDEADAAEGRITFLAPLARALLGKSVGDVVRLRGRATQSSSRSSRSVTTEPTRGFGADVPLLSGERERRRLVW